MKLVPQPFRSIIENGLDIKNRNFTNQTREEKIKEISKDVFRICLAAALGGLIWYRPAQIISRIPWENSSFRTITYIAIFAISPSSCMLLGAGTFAYLFKTSLLCAIDKKSVADIGGVIFTGLVANLLSENYRYHEKNYIGEDFILRIIKWDNHPDNVQPHFKGIWRLYDKIISWSPGYQA